MSRMSRAEQVHSFFSMVKYQELIPRESMPAFLDVMETIFRAAQDKDEKDIKQDWITALKLERRICEQEKKERQEAKAGTEKGE